MFNMLSNHVTLSSAHSGTISVRNNHLFLSDIDLQQEEQELLPFL